ncbi:hypothetical protein L6R52_04185 [Myxococcota bacterium]|nr:hypothetical protein [Myxococcota bacterium]
MSLESSGTRARATLAALGTVLWVTCPIGQVHAQSTADREADMFGEEPKKGSEDREASMFGEAATSSVAAGTSTASAAKTTRASEPQDREGSLFGGGEELRTDREVSGVLDEANDKLAVGGLAYFRLNYSMLDEGDPEDFDLRTPNILDVYLDARPSDRVRAYARGRLSFDPTLDGPVAAARLEASGFASLAGGGVSGTTSNAGNQATSVILDQLWLKTDIERTVFITLGRQRIKWGSGRTWNPTDFLNQNVRSPLDIFDVRTGVSMLKVHVPVEKYGWNFYGIATLDDTPTPENVGGAVRAEIVLGPTEVALTSAFKKDTPRRFGIDMSAGIWDFDVHAELALLNKVTRPFFRGTLVLPPGELQFPEEYSRKGDWIPQLVVGADIQIKYSDEDNITLGVEYFFNDAGTSEESIYPVLAQVGAFTPFYLGRHYASAFALLMAPGTWNDTSFILSALSNLSDGSVVTRLDYQVRLYRYLSLNAYGQLHAGSEGELRFGLELPPLPVEGLEEGLSIVPPRFQLGAGLRVDL